MENDAFMEEAGVSEMEKDAFIEDAPIPPMEEVKSPSVEELVVNPVILRSVSCETQRENIPGSDEGRKLWGNGILALSESNVSLPADGAILCAEWEEEEMSVGNLNMSAERACRPWRSPGIPSLIANDMVDACVESPDGSVTQTEASYCFCDSSESMHRTGCADLVPIKDSLRVYWGSFLEESLASVGDVSCAKSTSGKGGGPRRGAKKIRN